MWVMAASAVLTLLKARLKLAAMRIMVVFCAGQADAGCCVVVRQAVLFTTRPTPRAAAAAAHDKRSGVIQAAGKHVVTRPVF